jgi:hypothetical protein
VGVISVLFAVVLIGAVPLGIARLRLGDPAADRIVEIATRMALPSAALLAVGTTVAPSPAAAVLAAPWMAVTASLALGAVVAFVHDGRRLRPSRRLAVEIAFGFVAFGSANAMSYAAGFEPLGFSPTIVLLTAVHFHAAGFVLVTAGVLAFDRARSSATAVGTALVIAGSIVTAAGFVGVPLAATVGALAVASGGLILGRSLILVARELSSAWSCRLARLAGSALFVSMPLAIAWVVGGAIGVPAMGLDVMVRTHGAINALVVSVPAMAAWALDARSAR